MSFAKRIFHSLQVARTGNAPELFQSNHFLLDRLAYVQLNALNDQRTSFDQGPFIEAVTAKEEFSYWRIAQSIENTLKYSLRPYEIQFYGDVELQSTALPHILTRTWLSHTSGTNRMLAILERVDCRDSATYKYMVDINNNSWRPPADWDWMHKKSTTLVQTLLDRQPAGYPGKHVNLTLQ